MSRPPDDDRLRVAVIGVGSMGRQHARILSRSGAAVLVGVADADLSRAQFVGTEFECPAYDSYPRMLDEVIADATVVAVNTGAHYEVGLHVIERGIPLLIEKPLADTAANGRALVMAAEERRLPLAVGHVERFNPAVRELKRLIGIGELGEVLGISARRVGILPPRRSQTSVIVDLAVHDIDVATFLLDRSPVLVGAMSGRAWGHQHNDWADLLLAYGPVSCSIQVNWVTPIKVRTLTVTGSRGYAELNYITQQLSLYASPGPRDFGDFDEFVKRYGTPQRREIPVRKNEPLAVEIEAFVSAVRGSRPVEVSGRDALIALEAAEEAVRRSALQPAGLSRG